MKSAFNYIERHGGLGTEDSYPYQAVEGTCNKRVM
jgi:hypothetical protein